MEEGGGLIWSCHPNLFHPPRRPNLPPPHVRVRRPGRPADKPTHQHIRSKIIKNFKILTYIYMLKEGAKENPINYHIMRLHNLRSEAGFKIILSATLRRSRKEFSKISNEYVCRSFDRILEQSMGMFIQVNVRQGVQTHYSKGSSKRKI